MRRLRLPEKLDELHNQVNSVGIIGKRFYIGSSRIFLSVNNVESTSHMKSPKALKNRNTTRSSTEEKIQVVYGEEKTIDLTVRF
jgi:hypothetical protein